MNRFSSMKIQALGLKTSIFRHGKTYFIRKYVSSDEITNKKKNVRQSILESEVNETMYNFLECITLY